MKKEIQDLTYRFYIADSLFLQGENKRLSKKYSDMLQEKIDERTGDEIVVDIMIRAGLKFGE